MTIKSGTGQACAACKYQRRRCTPECLLAPFFPADQPKMFQNVHRLFGVKNIQNLLKELGPDHHQKATAMKSIKFHATMRDKYPVWGCMVEIQHLTYQIQLAEDELQAVLHQIAFYRQQQHQHQPQQDHPLSPTAADDYISELQLGMAPPGNDAAAFAPQQQQVVSYSNSSNGGGGDYGINYLDFKEMNSVVNSMCQQAYSNISNDNNPNSVVTQSHHLMMHAQPLHQPPPQDYAEMQPFFDNIDDTQSYIGSKEAYDQSSLSLESPFKDSRQLVEEIDENELKSAAACFSLTSVN
ncbi:LOB domain-containing protein 27-like [Salvia miltiorrhiza]|uniref:LOB domain-containing protein 27-like n=1 Tax=Salvia miltiorrhiza TaxID=226208 RepID=UPI0025AC1384|nr:LOB domain-containing protein 27-like [Salvia miltiorrhiza]